MMYLSRLLLNPRSADVRTDVADCQRMHCRILSGFPSTSPTGHAREDFGILYRVDIDPHRAGVIQVLVQSAIEPDWSKLGPDYLLRMGSNPACKPITENYSAIERGQEFSFRLRANPTKKVGTRPSPGQRRIGVRRLYLKTEKEWLAWLDRKAEQGGFAVLRVRAAPNVPNVRSVPSAKQEGKRHEETLTFGSVLFEGMLRVTDADAFRSALRDGLGSGKAYGFGLLSIAPV